MRFSFTARGHPEITAEHASTFEFTMGEGLTKNGDCIIAVGAECGLSGMPAEIRDAMRSPEAVMKVQIRCNGVEDVVVGYGDRGLTYASSREMVGRRSGYTCDRTLMVRADRAAKDIDRELVRELRLAGKVSVEFEVRLERDTGGN